MSNPTASHLNGQSDQEKQPTQVKLEIQRFYVKEQSCKIPQGAATFQNEGKPENTLELNLTSQMAQKDVYEVTLTLHVTQKINQRTSITLEVQQAGLFKIEQIEEKMLGQLLNAYCPNLLYPYACKVVSDLAVAASLPPIVLSPLNFEMMYQQRQQQASDGTIQQPTKTTEKHREIEESVE